MGKSPYNINKDTNGNQKSKNNVEQPAPLQQHEEGHHPTAELLDGRWGSASTKALGGIVLLHFTQVSRAEILREEFAWLTARDATGMYFVAGLAGCLTNHG